MALLWITYRRNPVRLECNKMQRATEERSSAHKAANWPAVPIPCERLTQYSNNVSITWVISSPAYTTQSSSARCTPGRRQLFQRTISPSVIVIQHSNSESFRLNRTTQRAHPNVFYLLFYSKYYEKVSIIRENWCPKTHACRRQWGWTLTLYIITQRSHVDERHMRLTLYYPLQVKDIQKREVSLKVSVIERSHLASRPPESKAIHTSRSYVALI